MTASLTLAPHPHDKSAGLPAAELYRLRRLRYTQERESRSRQWSLIANARLVAVAAAIVLLGWGILQQSVPFLLSAAVPFAAFLGLVAVHARLERRRKRLVLLEQLNEEAEQRVLRNWDRLPIRHTTRAPAGHANAADLDLFGRASLFQLLDAAGGTLAEPVLASWLLAPATLDVVRSRQAAVRELAPQVDERERIQLLARQASAAVPTLEPLFGWAEGPTWLSKRIWILWIARLAVLLLWLSILGQVLGFVAWPIWLVFLAVTLAIAATSGRDAYRIVASVRENAEPLRWYAESFAAMTASRSSAPALTEIANRLKVDGVPVHEEVRRLYRIGNFAIPPSAMLYGVVQALTLWDLNVLAVLEGWQRRCGERLRGWLEALAEFEALTALAVIAHDNPAWIFPDLMDGASEVKGENVGHPVLGDGDRIGNTVAVGPPGSFVLVTGSNMSGKSTYLRSIGINVVLALAGAPVCASSFTLPALAVWTSMRVQDSLERGVSFFMAELARIKQIVDAADRPADARVLYLLDEILLGTNTAERQTAARHIISHLVRSGAIGAISTHDLSLAGAPELAGVGTPVHFRERIDSGEAGPVMWFDYRLHAGLATSTNALRLMEIVGLPFVPTESSE